MNPEQSPGRMVALTEHTRLLITPEMEKVLAVQFKRERRRAALVAIGLFAFRWLAIVGTIILTGILLRHL